MSNRSWPPEGEEQDERIAALGRRVRRMEAALGDLAATLLGEKERDGYPVLRMWLDNLLKEIDRAEKQEKEGK
jgi:hypothetical protein